MGFSDILLGALPIAKLIIGAGDGQYNPGPKSENIYRECLYRTLDTLDNEVRNYKMTRSVPNSDNSYIPSQEMILNKLQQSTPKNKPESEYEKAINTQYKWSCKI